MSDALLFPFFFFFFPRCFTQYVTGTIDSFEEWKHGGRWKKEEEEANKEKTTENENHHPQHPPEESVDNHHLEKEDTKNKDGQKKAQEKGGGWWEKWKKWKKWKKKWKKSKSHFDHPRKGGSTGFGGGAAGKVSTKYFLNYNRSINRGSLLRSPTDIRTHRCFLKFNRSINRGSGSTGTWHRVISSLISSFSHLPRFRSLGGGGERAVEVGGVGKVQEAAAAT